MSILLGLQLTRQCYVAAITASGLCRNPASALEMLRTMEAVDGVKPNLFTYTVCYLLIAVIDLSTAITTSVSDVSSK
jgi:hypothetical protein